ncbi:hypothetical protein V1525DRAFT_402767 [Lipomyces kononenkoae]|uniref:Uncharacterized protein n=1 Tax=Lipomyces kononenkoae TaxID=34357 RepID=A0ACC3T2H4_LIPKO
MDVIGPSGEGANPTICGSTPRKAPSCSRGEAKAVSLLAFVCSLRSLSGRPWSEHRAATASIFRYICAPRCWSWPPIVISSIMDNQPSARISTPSCSVRLTYGSPLSKDHHHHHHNNNHSITPPPALHEASSEPDLAEHIDGDDIDAVVLPPSCDDFYEDEDNSNNKYNATYLMGITISLSSLHGNSPTTRKTQRLYDYYLASTTNAYTGAGMASGTGAVPADTRKRRQSNEGPWGVRNKMAMMVGRL